MRKWLILLCLCVFADALEVNLTTQHYQVMMKPEQSLDEAILMAAQSVPNLADSVVSDHHHAVSSYAGSVAMASFDYQYDAMTQRCILKDLTLSLNGEMVLPMLMEGSIDAQQAFAKEYAALKAHELHHQTLWQQALMDYEAYFHHWQQQDNPECDGLFTEINQEMGKTLNRIEAVNLAYDCDSYGEQFRLPQCQLLSDY